MSRAQTFKTPSAPGRAAPISLWGRLRYGPLLVPRYDQVEVAPLCKVAAGCLVPAAFHAAGVDDMIGLCASISIILALGILLPPSKYDWKLTGAHQSVRAARRGPTRGPEGGHDLELVA